MTVAHQRRVVVSVNDRVTGVPGDTTTPLVVSTNNTAVANAIIDPNDPRAVIITAHNTTGGCSINVQENPATLSPLSIPVNVSPPPDLSGVNFVSASDI